MLDEIRLYSPDAIALQRLGEGIVNLLIKQGIKTSGVISLPQSKVLHRAMIKCNLNQAHLHYSDFFNPKVLVRIVFK